MDIKASMERSIVKAKSRGADRLVRMLEDCLEQLERFHRSDQEEFYQLLNYVDDQDLNKKLGV